MVKDKNMTQTTIFLNRFVWKELLFCQKEYSLLIDKFIRDSLSIYLSNGLRIEQSSLISNGFPMRITIPSSLAWEVGILAMGFNVDQSDIINSALGHSLPVLLEEMKVMEETRIELEQG